MLKSPLKNDIFNKIIRKHKNNPVKSPVKYPFLSLLFPCTKPKNKNKSMFVTKIKIELMLEFIPKRLNKLIVSTKNNSTDKNKPKFFT